jgi:hypothetical protein
LPPSPGLRASHRPVQAAFVVRRRRRSRQFGSVHLSQGGRAWQGGRTGVEKSRGVGSRGDGVRRGRSKL